MVKYNNPYMRNRRAKRSTGGGVARRRGCGSRTNVERNYDIAQSLVVAVGGALIGAAFAGLYGAFVAAGVVGGSHIFVLVFRYRRLNRFRAQEIDDLRAAAARLDRARQNGHG
jgi:hypothetical protein